MRFHHLIAFLVFFALFSPNTSKQSRGIVATTSRTVPWVFVDRFCFFIDQGTLTFTIKYPKKIGNQSLILYFDTPEQWDSVYQTGLTCERRVAAAVPSNNQITHLFSPVDPLIQPLMECHPEVKQGLEWTICQGTQRFQSSRPRWWYFVISNCKPASWRGLSVFAEYKIEMKNGDSTFLKHFSADEYYVLPVDTGFLLLELILYILSIFLARALKACHFLHSTFKLCRVAILFEIISLSVLVWSYCGYGWHGIWILHSKNTGYYVRGVQQSLFLLFLLLVAKGYTITDARLSSIPFCKFFALSIIHGFLYIGMFSYAGSFDNARVRHVFESPFGYGVAVTKVYFLISARDSAKKYPEKRSFYIAFGAILMTPWFLANILTVMLTRGIFWDIVEEEVVNAFECFTAFYGFLVFMLVTLPWSSNRFFPFHIKTKEKKMVEDGEEDQEEKSEKKTPPPSIFIRDLAPEMLGIEVKEKK